MMIVRGLGASQEQWQESLRPFGERATDQKTCHFVLHACHLHPASGVL